MWHRWDASVQHCSFGPWPGCAWLFQGACSCVRVAAPRSCCAATATVAIGYCGRACWRMAHEAARRENARRYQRSRRGRLVHAERSRRWRQRCRARGEGGDGGGDGLQQNVTHQGCPPVAATAPLAAWTHHTTSAPEPAHTAATTPIAAGPMTATATPAAPWLCRRCAAQLPGWVRQGFVRHGPRPSRPRWRHDHSP